MAAKQVAALAAEEAARQIAAARDLANDVAMQTAPAENMKNPGAGIDLSMLNLADPSPLFKMKVA